MGGIANSQSPNLDKPEPKAFYREERKERKGILVFLRALCDLCGKNLCRQYPAALFKDLGD